MNEPSSHEDDLLDEALAAVRRMPTPERPPDSLVLESLHQAERGNLSPAPNTLYQRVLRMHPFVRYGIVTLVGSLLLLIGFGKRSGTLLLADVMKAVAKHQTVKFETKNESMAGLSSGSQVGPGSARQRPPMTWTNYGTLDRMHVHSEDSHGGVTTLDLGKGVFLTLFPGKKGPWFPSFPANDRRPDCWKSLNDSKMTNRRSRARNSSTESTSSSIASRRITSNQRSGPIATRCSPCAWKGRCSRGAPRKTTMTGFVWDPPIPDPEKFFSVEPPAGYEVTTRNLLGSRRRKIADVGVMQLEKRAGRWIDSVHRCFFGRAASRPWKVDRASVAWFYFIPATRVVHDQFYSTCKRRRVNRSADSPSDLWIFSRLPLPRSLCPLPSSAAPIFLWWRGFCGEEAPFLHRRKTRKMLGASQITPFRQPARSRSGGFGPAFRLGGAVWRMIHPVRSRLRGPIRSSR